MTPRRREQLVRRACRLMGWEYKSHHVYEVMRRVGIAEAVAISLEKLEEMLERIEELEDAILGGCELFGNYGFADESPCARDREIVAMMRGALESRLKRAEP